MFQLYAIIAPLKFNFFWRFQSFHRKLFKDLKMWKNIFILSKPPKVAEHSKHPLKFLIFQSPLFAPPSPKDVVVERIRSSRILPHFDTASGHTHPNHTKNSGVINPRVLACTNMLWIQLTIFSAEKSRRKTLAASQNFGQFFCPFRYTLKTKNFGQFKFRTSVCPKFRRLITQARTPMVRKGYQK